MEDVLASLNRPGLSPKIVIEHVEAVPWNSAALMVIGSLGIGKSTLMTCLAGTHNGAPVFEAAKTVKSVT